MNREELLREWANLAPGECRPVKRGYFALNGDLWNIAPAMTVVDRAVLLSAPIEAIRARGWHYVLHSLAEDAEAGPQQWTVATILTAPNWKEAEYEARDVEPCDALLEAYVAALKAERGKP